MSWAIELPAEVDGVAENEPIHSLSNSLSVTDSAVPLSDLEKELLEENAQESDSVGLAILGTKILRTECFQQMLLVRKAL